MFGKLGIPSQGLGTPEQRLDVGFLAEALLFHEDVHVFADQAILFYLLRRIGPELLLEYLRENRFKLTYLNGGVGIATQGSLNWGVRYSSPEHELQDVIEEELYRVNSRRGYSRRLASKYANHVDTSEEFLGVPEAVHEDFRDAAYIAEGVRQILEIHVNPAPLEIIFELEPQGDSFVVHTNLDFVALNQHLTHAEVGTLTPSYILATFLSARAQLSIAAKHSFTLASDAVHSGLTQLRVERAIEPLRKAKLEIGRFQDFILGNSFALSEALNSGQRNFTDLLKLLREADKFRHWLSKADPDAGLVTAYLKELTAQTWIEKLPPKAARWAIFFSGGIALDALLTGGLGTVLGGIVSLADTFLVDKLLKGWKPNQFVDTTLTEFVKPKLG